ncbi:2-dehydropantoate 2-reductase [Planctobacterium marinum]|uniref:2-dehydropantoate 2-reductase n=1 Tax=Planctobacterium marinum TaxID=1631968 RepID=UPI001E53340F|nr:2-dehydropantoate 2-reductase [Planctobacterium marinum]MCC2605430.1 2-dehydropantoate 2-reductase [Planctobacterium marinum]
MSTVIYGAGSIGCYIGAILHLQHVDVTLLGRQRIKDEIQQAGGITLSDYEGRHDRVTDVPFETSPQVLQQADIILVTLKCTAIESAIAEMQQHANPGALILCMQNGVGAVEQVKRAMPDFKVFAGITPFNVVQSAGARFHRATEGGLHLPIRAPLMALQSAWQEYGLGCELNENLEGIVWGKLLLNLNNAINALSDIPLKSQLQQRDYRRVLAQCQTELLQYCRTKNIKLAKLTAVAPDWIPFILRLPDWLFTLIAQKMLAIDPQARSSMWEDVSSGRKTEIDYLNGAVAKLAESVNQAAPANTAIYHLIKEVESGMLKPGIPAKMLLNKVQSESSENAK